MKKYIKVLLFVIVFFEMKSGVFAKMCNGISNSGSTATDPNAPSLFAAGYSYGLNNICGPYFSFDNTNTDTLFIDLVNKTVSKLDIGNAVDNSLSSNLPIVGKYEGELCPNYLYVNDKSFKEKEANGYEKKYFYVQSPYVCEYDSSSTGFGKFYLIYSKDDKKLYISHRSTTSDYAYNRFRVLSYNGYNHWFKDLTKSSEFNSFSDDAKNSLLNFDLYGCPNLFGYKYSEFNTTSTTFIVVVPTKQMLNFLLQKGDESIRDTYEFSGKKFEDNYYLSDYVKSIYSFNKEDLMNELDSCNNDSQCVLGVQIKIEKTIKDVSLFCNNVYSNCDYDDDMMRVCLNVDKEITEIKRKYNLSGADCGVSSRIIKFFANIFKWIKYIAPVLAIILGILDFVKAIASQSDDEMKKAQGKFVKRLIAAALLFIVPFIIEFILDKFNMAKDNPFCNLL